MPLRTMTAPCIATALAGLLLLGGCATKPPASDPEALADYEETNDPFEPTNRFFYAVNDTLDRYALKPVAKAYRAVAPETVRTHVHQLLVNINNPQHYANDVLQAKPRKAGNTMMRFLINTTAGVGGIFDVAADLGYPDHDNDFGLTLAVWSVPAGPFLFLPVLGPSNPRDAVGYGVNTVLDPFTWVGFSGSNAFGWSRFGLSAVDSRERVLDATDAIQKTALDPYATYRSLYTQARATSVEQAKLDLPATIPVWFPQAAAPPQPSAPPAGAIVEPASIAPKLAPSTSVQP